MPQPLGPERKRISEGLRVRLKSERTGREPCDLYRDCTESMIVDGEVAPLKKAKAFGIGLLSNEERMGKSIEGWGEVSMWNNL